MFAIDTTALDMVRGRRPRRAGHRPARGRDPARPDQRSSRPYRGGTLAAAITDDGSVVVFGMDTGAIVGSGARRGGRRAREPRRRQRALVVLAVGGRRTRARGRPELAELLGGDEAEYWAAQLDRARRGQPCVLDALLDRRQPRRPQGRDGRRASCPASRSRPCRRWSSPARTASRFLDADGTVFATIDLRAWRPGPRAGERRRRRQPALRHDLGRRPGDPEMAIIYVTGDGGRERPRRDRIAVPAAGAGHDGRVRRGRRAGRGPGRHAGRHAAHRLRRRAPRQERVRRPQAAVRRRPRSPSTTTRTGRRRRRASCSRSAPAARPRRWTWARTTSRGGCRA